MILWTIKKLTGWMQRRGSYATILRSGEPYLTRYFILNSKYFSLWLHQFHAPDDNGLHNHPWPYFTFILWGGYVERIGDFTRHVRKPGWFTYRHADEYHRVEKLLGDGGISWQLFIAGKRKGRPWGFLRDGVFHAIRERTDDGFEGIFFPRSDRNTIAGE